MYLFILFLFYFFGADLTVANLTGNLWKCLYSFIFKDCIILEKSMYLNIWYIFMPKPASYMQNKLLYLFYLGYSCLY